VENFAGTALALKKDYDGARSAFENSLKLDPDNGAARNNLAEIEFNAKHYAEAERLYREVLPNTPRKALVGYRIYTCLLLLKRDGEAAEMFGQFPQPPSGNSPAWYYAVATKAFLDGDAGKANEYLSQARMYYPDMATLYDPTLRQLGYIK